MTQKTVLPTLESLPVLTNEALVTGEELYKMEEIGRAELIEGRIATSMPTGHKHGYFEALLTAILVNFVLKHQLGRVLTGEVGIYIKRNPDTIRATDAAFISNKRYAQVQSHSYLDICPELIIEIMSPDDSWTRVNEKLRDYFLVEAKQVWVVDPHLKEIHVYRSLDEITRLNVDDTLLGGDILPNFELPIAQIFQE